MLVIDILLNHHAYKYRNIPDSNADWYEDQQDIDPAVKDCILGMLSKSERASFHAWTNSRLWIFGIFNRGGSFFLLDCI